MGSLTHALRVPPASALFLLAALAAGLSPFAAAHSDGAAKAAASFPGWPVEYEGRPLVALALTTREEAFMRDFPGRIGRFSDGRREIILRYVAEPTRRLHPASDCFKGSGYGIEPLPLARDSGGSAMGCFRATRGDETRTVCEAIRGAQAGETWSDASAWYWDALLGRSRGPWWSVVVAERSQAARISP